MRKLRIQIPVPAFGIVQKKPIFSRYLFLVMCMMALLSGHVGAEEVGYVQPETEGSQTREERLNEMKLQEAELDLQRARMWRDQRQREYKEKRKLFDEEVIALPEMNDARRLYERASLQYEAAKIYLEKMKLHFLSAATNISIVEARKYRTPDGKRMVQLILENTSNVHQGMTLNRDLSREQVAWAV